jgi:hypothetical protein
MISIGSVLRGPELDGSPFDNALLAASRALVKYRGPIQLGKSPLVNAVFVVPGGLGDPDFDRPRFGDYSKKDMAVVVQISVPATEVSTPEAHRFIVGALHGANAMAFEFFREKGQKFALKDAENLVLAVAEETRVSVELL